MIALGLKVLGVTAAFRCQPLAAPIFVTYRTGTQQMKSWLTKSSADQRPFANNTPLLTRPIHPPHKKLKTSNNAAWVNFVETYIISVTQWCGAAAFFGQLQLRMSEVPEPTPATCKKGQLQAVWLLTLNFLFQALKNCVINKNLFLVHICLYKLNWL